jgi:hypothetical protein
MRKRPSSSVGLYWIPLGAGGHSVRFNGLVFEAMAAVREQRPRCDLYHAALVVLLDGERYTIELAPARAGDRGSRGVVCTGAVGSRYLGWLRLFRYEIRCWRGGSIPDLDHAVGDPQRLAVDRGSALSILHNAPLVPTATWGRDELHAGEMWNSNSAIAWLIAQSGIPTDTIHPPYGGRAPGWHAGLTVASRVSYATPTPRAPRAVAPV